MTDVIEPTVFCEVRTPVSAGGKRHFFFPWDVMVIEETNARDITQVRLARSGANPVISVAGAPEEVAAQVSRAFLQCSGVEFIGRLHDKGLQDVMHAVAAAMSEHAGDELAARVRREMVAGLTERLPEMVEAELHRLVHAETKVAKGRGGK